MSRGSVCIHAEEATSSGMVTVGFSARSLENKEGFFGKSYPFFVISVAEGRPSSERLAEARW